MPELAETIEETDLIDKLAPKNAADGYTEHRVSDALPARHPYQAEQSAKVSFYLRGDFIYYGVFFISSEDGIGVVEHEHNIKDKKE